MATHTTLPPDTPITAKISVNGSTRRFKLALRDLGASVLPGKLRSLLAIHPNQDVIFERYSDSAASYVVLDSTNPAVYKQLYRAAKAKLKLRIKATLVNPPEDPQIESATLGEGALFPPAYTSRTSLPMETPVASSPVPAYVSPPEISVAEVQKVVADAVQDFLNGEEYINKLRVTVREEVEKHAAEAPVPAPPSVPVVPEARKVPTTFEAMGVSSDVKMDLGMVSAFAIFCNSCDTRITETHFHCSICDGGDYDLCKTCVDRGVHCNDSDHWLIKRTIADGNLTSSTTERIRPGTGSPKPPPSPISSITHTRTCNCCISSFPDREFVHCKMCDDYDLCVSCHISMKHGHNPRHEFVACTADTTLDALGKALLAPGRNLRHFAICDGCDKQIYGVRNKCLICPDWDYCGSCMDNASNIHPGHRFVPIYDPLPLITPMVTGLHGAVRHYGIYCDGPRCASKPHRTWIAGDRYKCAVCSDTDFCAGCEASPDNTHNQTHPLIKLKTAVRNVQVTTMENENVQNLMGDNQPTPVFPKSLSPATSNAATQVQTVADVKPTDDFVDFEDPIYTTLSRHQSALAPRNQSSPLQASFLEDAIPDGTKMTVGERFEQGWHMENTGSTNWPTGVSITFVCGDSMHNDVDYRTTLTSETRPGQTAHFFVALKAPLTPRQHISYWRLVSPDGTRFGHKLWCNIEVVEPEVEEKVEENTEKVEEKEAEVEVQETKEDGLAAEIKKEYEEYLAEVREYEAYLADAKKDSEQTVKVDLEASSSSQMIFPKLQLESPMSSTETLQKVEVHETPTPIPISPATTSRTLAMGDDDEEEEISSISDDASSFLTDDEYDVLDASDEEAFQECERVV